MLKKSLKIITIFIISLGLTGCANTQKNGLKNPIPNSTSFSLKKFDQLKIKSGEQKGMSLKQVETIFQKPHKQAKKTANKVTVLTAEWQLSSSESVDQPDTMTMSFSNNELTAISVRLISNTGSFALKDLQSLSDNTKNVVTRKMVDERFKLPTNITEFSSHNEVYVTYSYNIAGKKNKVYNFMFQNNNLFDEYQAKSE